MDSNSSANGNAASSKGQFQTTDPGLLQAQREKNAEVTLKQILAELQKMNKREHRRSFFAWFHWLQKPIKWVIIAVLLYYFGDDLILYIAKVIASQIGEVTQQNAIELYNSVGGTLKGYFGN